MALFRHVNWNRVLETEPAFIPHLDDALDTCYFDRKYSCANFINRTSGTCSVSMDKKQVAHVLFH